MPGPWLPPRDNSRLPALKEGDKNDDTIRFLRRPHWTQMDGLRGIAIALVFLKHSFYGRIARGGFIGVDLFFVLSGFLISYLLYTEILKTGGIHYGHFYMRRLLRIYPALVLLVILTGVAYRIAPHLIALAPSPLSFKRQAFDVLFYYSNVNRGNLFAHTWSLAVEEQFYLFWPVLLPILFVRFRRRNAVLAHVLLIGAFLLERIALWNAGYNTPLGATYAAPFCHSDGLVMGSLLALLLTRHDGSLVPIPVLRTSSLGLAFLLIFFTAAQWLTLDFRWMHSVGYIAVALISSGVVLTALYASPGSFLHKLLSLRSLVFLGRRSYGFYLYHPVVMALTEPLRVSHSYVNLFAVVALNLSLSLLLTELSYRFLEQPMLRLKARFEPVLLSRPAVV